MKFKRILSLLAVGLLLNSAAFSQENKPNPIYITVNGGMFKSDIDFNDTYDSDWGLNLGGGIGIPLPKKFYIIGKVRYFAKYGVPSISHYELVNGSWVVTSKTKDGSADFKQWFINGGIQYNISLNENSQLGFNAGISYTKITEKISSQSYSSNINMDGTLGYFVGLEYEYKFTETPFAVCADADYIFTRKTVENFLGNLGGLSSTLGFKYYIPRLKRR